MAGTCLIMVLASPVVAIASFFFPKKWRFKIRLAAAALLGVALFLFTRSINNF